MKVDIEAGANAGKSTQISLLAEAGFPVVTEKATEVIRVGGPLPWDDYDAFQFEVLRLQKAAERKVDAEARRLGLPSFRDRGQLSGIVYRLLLGLKVPDFFRLVDRGSTDVCLLLEHVPEWRADGIRYDNLDLTRALFPVYRYVYEKAGIPVVRVPFLERARARMDFSLSKLGLKPPPSDARGTFNRPLILP
jgi:predicted ATPase